MPYFFQFSKNGRKENNGRSKDKPEYLNPNSSTMNRICSSFDDVGRLKMNYSNIPPFNYQMLLPAVSYSYFQEAVEKFCDLDDCNLANLIESIQRDDTREKTTNIGYELLKEEIIEQMISICGSMECAYQSVTKYLFAGQNANKSAHKQMYWRVFGELACKYLSENMEDYAVCDNCGQKIPSWTSSHTCPKTAAGFLECVDCGAWCERLNSRQCRCADCQDEYTRIKSHERRKKFRSKDK